MEGIVADAQELVPRLKEEFQQLTKELLQEQATVAEIEQCDPDYLSDLKSSIADHKYVLAVSKRTILTTNIFYLA